MLFSTEIIRVVVDFFKEGSGPPLVVDPVMMATSGERLLKTPAIKVLKEELLPLAALVTPNVPEAEVLADCKIDEPEDLRNVARRIRKDFGCAVLIKGGIDQATRALALELAPKGVRVNAIAPGVIDTPMHDPATHEFLKTMSPMKRIGNVAQIVDAALYLADAEFTSGVVLPIDGGATTGRW